MKRIVFFFSCFLTTLCLAQTHSKTYFEKSNFLASAPYEEGISYFEKLATNHKQLEIKTFGTTDIGKPLHLVIYSSDGQFDMDIIRKQKRAILFINNAIHPGEPDGVDASMLLVRDLTEANSSLAKKVGKTVIAIVPYYNIGGTLNRNSSTRANQNGPTAYGFRGNAKNYDLNRDFIKADSQNALSFQEIFHYLKPQVFVDTHVSNGADYQYTMTLIEPQTERLAPSIASLSKSFTKAIYQKMASHYPMVPYVNVFGTTPDKGYQQMTDYSRYSSGYVGLFHTLGYTSETHMLKPFKDRVFATKKLLENFAVLTNQETSNLYAQQTKAFEHYASTKTVALDWELDLTKPKMLSFDGYEYHWPKSEVTGKKRLKYDRSKPKTFEIPYFNQFKAIKQVSVPQAYLIPKAWKRTLENLKNNAVSMIVLKADTMITVSEYIYADFKTVGSPYEGHYFHRQINVNKNQIQKKFVKGDVLVPTNQTSIRYILEVLEPESPDGFFAWNYYDTRLQQKEHYSAYVFEDLAAAILKKNPALKKRLEEQKKTNPDFAKDPKKQLDFVYEHSAHYEPVHKKHPIFRIEK